MCFGLARFDPRDHAPQEEVLQSGFLLGDRDFAGKSASPSVQGIDIVQLTQGCLTPPVSGMTAVLGELDQAGIDVKHRGRAILLRQILGRELALDLEHEVVQKIRRLFLAVLVQELGHPLRSTHGI